MKDNYQIRFAQEDELQLLNDIEETASTLFANTNFALEVDQEPLSIELLQEQQKQDLVWVVVDDRDSPVGFAVVIIMGDRAHLHELSVDPVHGRQGLGTRLMKGSPKQVRMSCGDGQRARWRQCDSQVFWRRREFCELIVRPVGASYS